jgi:N4-gp56 family major capsid protein
MAGQIWSSNTQGGYLYADNLSDYLRFELQPRTKMRNFCDASDKAIGLHKGNTFRWDRFSKLANRGGPIDELQKMPETNFTIGQASLTIGEFGNSVPYTGLLENLGEIDVKDIIDQTLRDDCRQTLDRMTGYEFFRTSTRVAPTSGTSTTSLTLTTNGATATTNNVELGSGHIKAVSDIMKDRNVPAYDGDDYCAITHATNMRTFKNDLEGINKYTEVGIQQIFKGEVGRYENFRFVEQNEIPKGHANDAAFNKTAGSVNNIYQSVDDAWNNGKASWALFFGADTVLEAPAVPEEIRAKLPGDYGRDKGIAWYYLGGAGLVHEDALNSRVFMFDSAA